MLHLIWGATAMGCLTAGCHFLLFWRRSHDRLFLAFALAFAALAANWVGLVAVSVVESHQMSLVRLLAFVLLIVAIIDKNRKR